MGTRTVLHDADATAEGEKHSCRLPPAWAGTSKQKHESRRGRESESKRETESEQKRERGEKDSSSKRKRGGQERVERGRTSSGEPSGTAGGAFLEALENKYLPGIQALMAD